MVLKGKMMIRNMLEEIQKRYSCRQVSTGDFAKVSVAGARISIEAYDAEGLGRVAVVFVRGFLNRWKMQSMIIHPLQADIPVYYYHRHDRKGNELCKVELIDTQVNPIEMESVTEVLKKYEHIPDAEDKENWYDDLKMEGTFLKKVKKSEESVLGGLIMDHLCAYLNLTTDAKKCTESRKKAAARPFVDGLVEKGGIAVLQLFRVYYDKLIAKRLCLDILFDMK